MVPEHEQLERYRAVYCHDSAIARQGQDSMTLDICSLKHSNICRKQHPAHASLAHDMPHLTSLEAQMLLLGRQLGTSTAPHSQASRASLAVSPIRPMGR